MSGAVIAFVPKQTKPVKVDEGCDPEGTAFNREAGIPCQVCPRIMRPKFMGNNLHSYECDCGHTISG